MHHPTFMAFLSPGKAAGRTRGADVGTLESRVRSAYPGYRAIRRLDSRIRGNDELK